MKMSENTTQVCKPKMNAAIFLGVLVSLSACAGSSSNTSNKPVASSTPAISNVNNFKIKFDWEAGMNKCFSTKSPPIQLMNVPAGTKSFKVVMVDEDSSYDHGGGKVAYSGGSVISAGALNNWQGPCPPLRHKYTFKVTAYGGQKVRAKYSQNYPK